MRVVLADENDNAPRFRAVEYRMSIKANVAKGSLVTQIQAADPDAGSNGRVTYSLYSEARLSLVDVLEVSTFPPLTTVHHLESFKVYLHIFAVCLNISKAPLIYLISVKNMKMYAAALLFNLDIFPSDTPTPVRWIKSHLLTVFLHFTHQMTYFKLELRFQCQKGNVIK